MAELVPVDFDPFGHEPPKGRKFELVPVDHDPFEKKSTAGDIARSASAGLAQGVAGLVGLPDALSDLGARGIDAATRFIGDQLGIEAKRPEPKPRGYVLPTTEMAADAIKHHVTDPLGLPEPGYKPETTAGKYAKTASEFVPGALLAPGGIVGNAIRYGVVPGLASEAAGQATEGSSLEGPARFAGALAAGGAAALVRRPATAAKAVAEQLPNDITPAMVDQAAALIDQAAQQGITLSWPEALTKVAGRPVLTNVLRHLEGAPQTEARMSEYFGKRPQEVQAAGREALSEVGPSAPEPSALGQDVASAARSAVADTPEGRHLANTVWQAGPRVSPGDAGAVIQPDLTRVQAGREGMRAALADQDYTAARNAPETVPLDGGFGFRDVTAHHTPERAYPVIRDSNGQMRRMTPQEEAAANLEAPMPVHPVTRDPATGRMRRMTDEEIAAEASHRQSELDAALAQRQTDLNPTERMAVIGLKPTQFAQVDTAPVIAYLDTALQSAKGAVRQGLQAARGALFTPDGSIDGSVNGLHSARMAFNDLIDQAKRAGANNTVRELEQAMGQLDDALEQVPAYGQARRNYRAASEPLAPFESNRAPGRITERDQFNQRPVMPPEDVPFAIQNGGASAARDFNAVASPTAREAFEQHLVTQVLDAAQKSGADISANAIRSAIRQNEDLLRQYPGVQQRLENIAAARDGLERVLASPIGKLAARDTTTKKAIDALFPANPLPNSEQEISRTVGELAKRSPNVAASLVRMHIESIFNETTQALQSGANQAGGAKFVSTLVGNPQQKANLEAAIKSLPFGDERLAGLNKFLEVAEATGARMGVGSRTAYNAEMLKNQSMSGIVGEGGKALANPLNGAKFLADRFERWKLGSNLNEIASILTDPAAVNRLRALAHMKSGASGQALTVAIRLANFGAASKSPPVNETRQ